MSAVNNLPLQEAYVQNPLCMLAGGAIAGFTQIGSSCYGLFNITSETTQQALMEKCSTDYGLKTHLLAIESEEESMALHEFMQESGKLRLNN